MAAMSIGKAWEEAVAFVAREKSLLFPVALLFVALPGLILQEMTPPELASWNMTRQAMPDVPVSFLMAMLLTVLLVWFGSLTLFALALRPGISVGEALRLSIARLPVLLGTALVVAGLLAAAVLSAALVTAILAMIAKPLAAALATLLGVGVVALAIFASVRLLLLNPVVIDGQEGVMASLRQGWSLTRGYFWRLLGFILILTLLSAIVGAAAQAVFGLFGAAIGGQSGGHLIGGVASAAISTVVQVYMLVMLARLYRQAVAG